MSGAPPPDPRFRFAHVTHYQGLCPWTPLGTSIPQTRCIRPPPSHSLWIRLWGLDQILGLDRLLSPSQEQKPIRF